MKHVNHMEMRSGHWEVPLIPLQICRLDDHSVAQEREKRLKHLSGGRDLDILDHAESGQPELAPIHEGL